MKVIEVKGNVGEHPTTCDHCGGPVEEIGLVAPKCTICGKFSLSHISFGAPEEVVASRFTWQPGDVRVQREEER